MAIIQGIFAAIGRAAGKLLNTVFAWATVMIFGKVPEGRQIYVSIIGFGSVAWIITVLGIAFPSFATFMLGFVKLPSWVDKSWIRLVMLVAAVVLPLIVGGVSLLLLDAEDRPRGVGAKLKAVLKGYRFTLGLAVTLIMMVIFAPFMKIAPLIRRWTGQHVPMIVEEQDYLEVVGEIQQALKVGGWEAERRPATWMLRLPTKVFTLLAGGDESNLVADNLTTLKAPALEVMLHPSDLVITGPKFEVAHARATISEQLAFSKAYMTWSKEANQLEDRLSGLWREMQGGSKGFIEEKAVEQLQAIERDLKALKSPYEEWEVLFRKKLLVERGLLQVKAGITDRPKDLTQVAAAQNGAAEIPAGSGPRRLVPRLAALGVVGLLAWLRLRRPAEGRKARAPTPGSGSRRRPSPGCRRGR
jgi:hypothetical protein